MKLQASLYILLLCFLSMGTVYAQKADKAAKKQARKAKKAAMKKAQKEAAEKEAEMLEDAQDDLKRVSNPYVGASYMVPSVEIAKTNTEIEGTSHEGFELFIKNTEVKKAQKRWKKWMKKRKAKVSDSNIFIFADNAVIENIGAETADTYVHFKERDKDVKMTALVDAGKGFVSNDVNPEQTEDIKQFLTNFALTFAKDHADDEYGDSKKDLKKMQGSLKKMQKQNENYHKDIAKYKQLIEEAELAIEKNMELQKEQRAEITEQEYEVKHKKKLLEVFED